MGDGPWKLVPLLLPEGRGRLLMLGWHPALLSEILNTWNDIEINAPDECHDSIERWLESLPDTNRNAVRLSTSNVHNSYDAVVACGFGSYGWSGAIPAEIINQHTPFVALARGKTGKRWMLQLREHTITFEGLPNTGAKPLLWVRMEDLRIQWPFFTPRGRLTLSWIQFQAILRRFRFPLYGWVLIMSSLTSPLSLFASSASPSQSSYGSFWYHTKTDSLFVFCTDIEPGKILKVPLNKKARSSTKSHYEHLVGFKGDPANRMIADLVPEVAIITSEKHIALAEQTLPGVNAFRYLARRRELRQVTASAASVLTKWQKENAVAVTISERLFEEYWEKPLLPLEKQLKRNDKGYIYKDCLRILREISVGSNLPLVPIHGDYWLNNIIWDPRQRRITGILDWDHSSKIGLPLLDVFHLLFWRTHFLYDLNTRWAVSKAFKRNFPGTMGQIVSDYCKELNIPESQVLSLFCRYWLGEVAAKFDSLMASRESWRALTLMHRYLLDLGKGTIIRAR